VAPATIAQSQHVAVLERAGIRAVVHQRPPSRVRETLHALMAEPALVSHAVTRPVLAWQVSVFWHELRPLARRVIAESRPDVANVEHDWSAAWAADALAGVPAALTFQNLSWRYYDSRAAAAPRALRRFLSLESARFRRFDRQQLRHYGLALTMSKVDAADLQALDPPAVEVVPNGVATDELEALEDSPDPPVVLFTGTLAYPPNAEGIVWFAEQAWPHVRREVPEAILMVVGRDPPSSVRELAGRPGVELAGFLPDLRVAFERATVAIAPVLSGGGTRLKALEAMAWQRALVSTRVGVEGIEVVPGEHALVEDDPERFATAVVELLQDTARRRRLAASARRLTEARYDWRLLGDRLGGALERLAGAG
jgi:glycosyltransferase involved in cell wall biosynthesis